MLSVLYPPLPSHSQVAVFSDLPTTHSSPPSCPLTPPPSCPLTPPPPPLRCTTCRSPHRTTCGPQCPLLLRSTRCPLALLTLHPLPHAIFPTICLTARISTHCLRIPPCPPISHPKLDASLPYCLLSFPLSPPPPHTQQVDLPGDVLIFLTGQEECLAAVKLLDEEGARLARSAGYGLKMLPLPLYAGG